jgi:acetyl esterase/lipase
MEHSEGDIKEILDLSYGADPKHKWDLYLPQSVESAKGIIIFVHGGAWRR